MAYLVGPIKVNGTLMCLRQLPIAGTDNYRMTLSEKTQPDPNSQTAPTGEGTVGNPWRFDGGANNQFNGVVYAGINCVSEFRVHVTGTYQDDGGDYNGLTITHNGTFVAGSGHNLFGGGYYGQATGPGPQDISETVTISVPSERPCGHIIYAAASWLSSAPASGHSNNESDFTVWIEAVP